MRRLLLGLVLLGLVVVPATAVTAQPPCQPSCDLLQADVGASSGLGALIPFLAVAVVLARDRIRPG